MNSTRKLPVITKPRSGPAWVITGIKELRRTCFTTVKHVLRNSLIPVITQAGPLLGFVITGSFLVEFIFSVPGLGKYYVSTVSNRDYSVVMGLTVLLSALVVAANLVVDILYGVLDPRIRND